MAVRRVLLLECDAAKEFSSRRNSGTDGVEPSDGLRLEEWGNARRIDDMVPSRGEADDDVVKKEDKSSLVPIRS